MDSEAKPLHGEWTIRDSPYSLPVDYTVEHERYNRQHFQQAGHFVCGMTDANGFRRPWNGNEVHVLTLRYGGESPLRDLQMLRVMGDSHEEAERLMQTAIRDTLRSLWHASQLDQDLSEKWRQQNDQRNQFQHWIDQHYAVEIAAGEHRHFATVFETAMHYMHKERQRLSVRLINWLNRKKHAATQP